MPIHPTDECKNTEGDKQQEVYGDIPEDRQPLPQDYLDAVLPDALREQPQTKKPE